MLIHTRKDWIKKTENKGQGNLNPRWLEMWKTCLSNGNQETAEHLRPAILKVRLPRSTAWNSPASTTRLQKECCREKSGVKQGQLHEGRILVKIWLQICHPSLILQGVLSLDWITEDSQSRGQDISVKLLAMRHRWVPGGGWDQISELYLAGAATVSPGWSSGEGYRCASLAANTTAAGRWMHWPRKGGLRMIATASVTS